jgi:tRNA nucleotidyltransferase (CCA-adding enzyme)
VTIPEHLLDGWAQRVLRAAQHAAIESRSLAYLVGGPVRDVLRGATTGDPDLAVQGNEHAFAASLARLLGAALIENERFLTWRLSLPSGHHVDLARLRTESYPQPGALPVVQPAASIEQDLGRRDFTVNAMAFRLADGEVVDPFGGRADLGNSTLRILHDRSFIDDPTRVLRASRLSVRCGFSIEPRTSALLDAAVASGALTTVSPERLWKEIELACGEEMPVAVLRVLAARRCLATVPGVEDASGLDRLPDNLSMPEGLDRRVILLGALLRRGAPATAFDALPFDRSTANRVRAIASRNPSLSDLLAASPRAEDQFAACEAASGEERFLATAESAEAAAIIARYGAAFDSSRVVRGDTLGVPPGPWISRAVRETRLALFAGTIPPAEAPAFARRRAMEYLND